jgi:hypothetical protein
VSIHGALQPGISPRSRIFRRKISSHLTTWEKNRFSLGKCVSLRKENSAGAVLCLLCWSSLTVPIRKWCSGEEFLWSSRTTLKQFALGKTLLLRAISSLSCRIFDYKRFSGGVLLSHNTVNELCYVAQLANSFMT